MSEENENNENNENNTELEENENTEGENNQSLGDSPTTYYETVPDTLTMQEFTQGENFTFHSYNPNLETSETNHGRYKIIAEGLKNLWFFMFYECLNDATIEPEVNFRIQRPGKTPIDLLDIEPLQREHGQIINIPIADCVDVEGFIKCFWERANINFKYKIAFLTVEIPTVNVNLTVTEIS